MRITINLNVKWSNDGVVVNPIPDPSGDIKLFPNWETTVESGGLIELENGVTYLVPNYRTSNITSNLTITCNGKAKIIFGKDNYNYWKGDTEDRFIFNLGRWNNHIKIENVDIFTGKILNQVQPFFRTLFWNTTEKDQIGTIELINSNTNLEYGLLYSGSQLEYLTAKAINVDFEGYWFEELKCPNGGGLLSYKRNCNLKMIDAVTHFEANLSFSKNEVTSNISFLLIENEFNGNGNSCNILYVNGMTFYLPKGIPTDEFKHHIRPIPQVGESYVMTADNNLIRVTGSEDIASVLIGNTTDFQAGDILSYEGVEYTILRKNRLYGSYFEKSGYSMFYILDKPFPVINQEISVKVEKSIAEYLLDNNAMFGYMIFKYNRDFITTINEDAELNDILKSNPLGVLSYNHEEITADWENVNHNGFYRQSRSGIGNSNGYRIVNCTGLKDQFNPPVEIKTT